MSYHEHWLPIIKIHLVFPRRCKDVMVCTKNHPVILTTSLVYKYEYRNRQPENSMDLHSRKLINTLNTHVQQ